MQHRWIPAKTLVGHLAENNDFSRLSQTMLALPLGAGQECRIIAEICGGPATLENVREKLWQIEKDLLYFACKDQWRLEMGGVSNFELRPLHVEEQCAFVAVVFPVDHLGVMYAKKVMTENSEVLSF